MFYKKDAVDEKEDGTRHSQDEEVLDLEIDEDDGVESDMNPVPIINKS